MLDGKLHQAWKVADAQLLIDSISENIFIGR